MTTPSYEVYAIRYARRDARRHEHFVGGDPHDAPMHMDYFVWLIRNADRTIVVDTGFTAEVAAKRKREYIRTPKAGLALMGVKAEEVRDVVITHMHYDHVGTFFDFPNATFHIQDDEMNFVTGRYMRHARFAHSIEVEDVIAHGEAAAEIVRVARERGADLIVISSHGRTGLGRILFGSTAESVVRHAHCPVLVVKPPDKSTEYRVPSTE